MSCRLLFVRHGQSIGNFNRCFLGHTDLDLSELGYCQAELVGKYLSGTDIDKIYSSDLIRAYNTAVPLAHSKNQEIIKSKKLREIFAGQWEGLPLSVIAEKYKASYDIWRNNIGRAIPDGGEAILEVQKRIVDTVTQIALENDGNTVVIFTHATVIRTFFAFVEGKKSDEIKDLQWPSNASVSCAVFNDGEFKEDYYSRDNFLGNLGTSIPGGV